LQGVVLHDQRWPVCKQQELVAWLPAFLLMRQKAEIEFNLITTCVARIELHI
jgi:hypothetical protein